ncbi:MAG TPA: polysaccharide biosynthesis/export family protein [Terriglobales bacterium]|nr:polysaccharide biosynthesis/export family protein [Terriglobales bacterium]
MWFERARLTNLQWRRLLLCSVITPFLAFAVAAQDNAEPVAGAALKATQDTSQPAVPAPRPATEAGKQKTNEIPAQSSELRLGAGDLVELNVYNVPELSTKARVSGNGEIYLPLVDYVHIGGLSLQEAQTVIEKRYEDGGFLKDPHISLLVDESATQGASVLGEVSRPGVYPVLGQPRLLDLVSAAGGFTDRAGRVVTITHRDQPDQPVTVTLPRNPADKSESNIQVYPGDMIAVHRADIVYVVGEVGKPSGFLMDTGSLSVLQAIALAGGVNRTAKLNDAKIIRKTPEGAMTETPIQLKKILAAKAPDLPMQADDILFVPTSTGKIAAARGIEAAVAAATGLAIVAAHP